VELDGKNLLEDKIPTLFPLWLVNPVVTDQSEEKEKAEEGCLSVPNFSGRVIRPRWVAVQYQDYHGSTHVIRADGLLGRCLQHEIDHLNGILFVDYLSKSKRRKMRALFPDEG
jgi:peptide deformylase